MVPMVVYKINIHAVIEDINGEYIESKQLHEKIIQTIDENDMKLLTIHVEDKEKHQ